jgi:hypothetical protein
LFEGQQLKLKKGNAAMLWGIFNSKGNLMKFRKVFALSENMYAPLT